MERCLKDKQASKSSRARPVVCVLQHNNTNSRKAAGDDQIIGIGAAVCGGARLSVTLGALIGSLLCHFTKQHHNQRNLDNQTRFA